MAKRKIIQNQLGFTLMEVMIAMSIFAVFATAFVTGQGYNLLDSGQLKNEILLKDLCENKINEIIINPPELKESLTLSKETKSFENYPDYQYTIEYKKLFVPDYSKLKGSKEGEQESAEDQMEKRVFKIFKENMEKMIWQVEVTVKNKLNDSQFRLSTWLNNPNADVQIEI